MTVKRKKENTSNTMNVVKEGKVQEIKINILEDAPLLAGLEDSLWHRKLIDKPGRITSSPKKVKAVKPDYLNSASTPTSAVKIVYGDGKTANKKAVPVNATSSVQSKAAKPDLLLSVPEMCALLGVSRATLVRMDNAGKIPGRIKLGGSVRYHRAIVESWLLEMAQSTPL